MYSKNDSINHTRHFIGLLQKNGITIQHAFLFGSYARDKAHAGSDIDVPVVSPDFSGFRFADLGKIARWKLQSNKDLDVIPFGESDFVNNDPLVKQILETGIRIS